MWRFLKRILCLVMQGCLSGRRIFTREGIEILCQVQIIVRQVVTNIPCRKASLNRSPGYLPRWVVLYDGNMFRCLVYKSEGNIIGSKMPLPVLPLYLALPQK